jgi:glucose/arabinose dehydrogenase
MKPRRIFLSLGGLLILAVAYLAWKFLSGPAWDPFAEVYRENCANCHGMNLEGVAALGPPLANVELQHGDSLQDLRRSIAEGYPERGMPAWSSVFDDATVQALAIYIAERRADRVFTDFRNEHPLVIPEGVVRSELHDFRVEVFAAGIHPLPFSIAPLPDGSFLVTEKTQGLRVISPDGALSAPVTGTPEVHDDGLDLYSIRYGLGWLLEVAAHPAYASNGWIYLHHTDRCTDCDGLAPVSMNRVIRGRLRGGAWVDEEVIWEVDKSLYSFVPDVGAGGRLTFDDAGHLYFSVGMKGSSNFDSIQDLARPSGKTHRLRDDGTVPADNPFVGVEGAWPSTWTYGHRSPQGLEWNRETGELWGTEMGPRGGDELNRLRPGRNYGWPLTSLGLDYDGTPVEYGDELGIEFDIRDIEQPVADFTPSPAISSFVFYRGDAFPRWRNQAIIGSLKGTELYRVVLDDNRVVHRETLLSGLARIRDVETGYDGYLYLLLEHASGSQLVRLVPAPN